LHHLPGCFINFGKRRTEQFQIRRTCIGNRKATTETMKQVYTKILLASLKLSWRAADSKVDIAFNDGRR